MKAPSCAAMAAVAAFLCGCASTTVYRNGKPILATQANARSLEFRQGDTYLKIEGLNHSTPTRAGGSVLGTGLSGATAAATAVLAGGL